MQNPEAGHARPCEKITHCREPSRSHLNATSMRHQCDIKADRDEGRRWNEECRIQRPVMPGHARKSRIAASHPEATSMRHQCDINATSKQIGMKEEGGMKNAESRGRSCPAMRENHALPRAIPKPPQCDINATSMRHQSRSE